MLFLVSLFSLLGWFFSFSALAGHAPALDGSEWRAPPALRVRVMRKVHEFQISGEGIQISDAHPQEKRGAVQAPLWRVVCESGKILIKSEGYQKVVGQGAERRVVRGGAGFWVNPSAVSFEKPGGVLYLGKNAYRDILRVRLVDAQSCDVMNDIDLEKYLDGLVNSEFSSKWHEEAIAAQIIAARTYAYHQYLDVRSSQKKRFFDLDASTQDQVYEGASKESSRASRIAERTRGMILATYLPQKERWEPVKAFYHSACGGLTELPEKVWKKKFAGFKRQVSCAFCKESPVYQWSLSLSSEEITQLILERTTARERKDLGLSSLEQMTQPILVSMKVDSDSEKSRVLRVHLTWRGEQSTHRQSDPQVFHLSVSGARLRDWIGTTRLKSTWFTARPVSSSSSQVSWIFDGFGNGHGVGMCQWGAKRMGERGFSYASILQYYYPAALLKKIW